MFGNAGLNSSRKSYHSARKTGIQYLLHAGIPPTNVQQLFGHKRAIFKFIFDIVFKSTAKDVTYFIQIDYRVPTIVQN